jgi:6-phosphogluconolactonase (cycloisomerase 2 family)
LSGEGGIPAGGATPDHKDECDRQPYSVAGEILCIEEASMFHRENTAGRNLFVSLGILLVAVLGSSAARLEAQGLPGAVYVMTNQSSANSIAVFSRMSTGSLRAVGTFPTGGTGFGTGGDPLASEGALILTDDGHFLLACNAGSNDISVMQVTQSGLAMVDRVPSGGTEPVSITLYKNLAYVLNAGGTPNITGFALSPEGGLTMIPGSTQPLAGGTSAGPAGISFTPDGAFLAVTEKGTNLIDTYIVDQNGVASAPISNPSNGMTPFGFAFGRTDSLIVSEAFGGGANEGAASSYRIADSGDLVTVSGSVPDTQTAPCWVAVTNNGRMAFLSNTGTGTISSYSVGADGSLTLLKAVAGFTGASSAPIDMALSANSKYLYVLSAAQGTVSAFQVETNGNLMRLASTAVGRVPMGSQGIAAQ